MNIFHVEFFTLLSAMITGFWFLCNEMKRLESRLDATILRFDSNMQNMSSRSDAIHQALSDRSDKLYQMFYELVREKHGQANSKD